MRTAESVKGASPKGGGPYRAAIITASDKGFRGEREDQSGPLLREMLRSRGYQVASAVILPDEREALEQEMRRICDEGRADLILTTGGTGFSPRDITPEATLAVAERMAPGIPEAMRMRSLAVTGRAMLSRAVAAIRGRTLIVNLPGSPKAARETLGYIIDELAHGLDILTGGAADCASE
jgi:molybdenum cofactor synthesis domain-containing protein